MSNTWTGMDAGVREPMTGETPLSPAEVGVGLRTGALTGQPAPRRAPGQRMQAVVDALLGFWAKGATTNELVRATGMEPFTAMATLSDLHRRKGWIYKLEREHHLPNDERVRHFHADVPHPLALVTMRTWSKEGAAQLQARMKTVQAETAAKDAQKRLTLQQRNEQRALAAKERAERLAAERLAAQEQKEAAERAAFQRRQDVVKLKREAQRQARELCAAEVQAAKAPVRSGRRQADRQSREANAIAAKCKGTLSPSALVKPAAKPAPTPIPEHLIQKLPGFMEARARLNQGAGVISPRIGEYEGEPSRWVREVVA